MDNFDLRKFLIENQLTENSKQLDEVNIRKGLRNLAAGAAMMAGVAAHGQETPKQELPKSPITTQEPQQGYQKEIDKLKARKPSTSEEAREIRALITDLVKKRNAQRLAPIEAAQEERIKNWIEANPGSTREDYFKAHERSDKFCVTGDDSESKRGGSCGAATSLQKSLNGR
jgi:hypothetical protein